MNLQALIRWDVYGLVFCLLLLKAEQMKDKTSYCKCICIGLLCAISCIDSTFYNRDTRFRNHGSRFKNGTVKNKKQNNYMRQTNRMSMSDPWYQDPQHDPLYRDYFRQLEREFNGRGSLPVTDASSKVLKQNERKVPVDRTFLSNNHQKGTDATSKNFKNKNNNWHPRRDSLRNNRRRPPGNANYRKRPIVSPPIKPQRRFKDRDYWHKKKVNGYGRHHLVPDRLGRRLMADCNFQNEVDVAQLFPGLFRSETDVMQQPDMKIRRGTARRHMEIKELPKVLWCPEDEKQLKREQQPQRKMSLQKSHQGPISQFAAATIEAKTIESHDPVLTRPSLSSRRRRPCNPGCCKHFTGYAPITEVNVNNVTYTAVNTTLLNQYLPVGVCPDTNTCGSGMCIQHQLTHWVLIFNNSLPYWPPLQFTRIELPGYCTWENVHP